MRRVLIVVIAAVLAMLAGSFASAEPDKPGAVSQAGKAPAQVLAVRAKWVNVRSDQCLDQDYTNGVPHSAVLAWPCNEGANQNWIERYNPNGSVTLVNELSGQCLDQDFSNGVPHSAVLAWPCNGGANQQWFLFYEPDGTYWIGNGASPDVLDQDYTNGVPHPTILAWPYNGGLNQFWRRIEL